MAGEARTGRHPQTMRPPSCVACKHKAKGARVKLDPAEHALTIDCLAGHLLWLCEWHCDAAMRVRSDPPKQIH